MFSRVFRPWLRALSKALPMDRQGTPSRSARRLSCQPQIEELESRLVLTAKVSLANGVLRAIADNKPTTMTLRQVGGQTILNGFKAATKSIKRIEIRGGNKADTVVIHDTPAGKEVRVKTGGGNDAIHVGSAANLLSSIQGRLSIDGGAGIDALTLHDTGEAGQTYDLLANSVNRSGAAPISFSPSLESLTLDSGAGTSQVKQLSTPTTTQFFLNLAGGTNSSSPSSTISGSTIPGAPVTSEDPRDREPSNLAVKLDHDLDLTAYPEEPYENWGGKGEKWVLDTTQKVWYFILPTGELYHWDGSVGSDGRELASGELVATLDPSYHADLHKLTQAESLLAAGQIQGPTAEMAARLDHDLGLHVEGEDAHLNLAGRQEKWLQNGAQSEFYFILPAGELYHWDGSAGSYPNPAASGELLATLDPSYYQDLSKLTEAAAFFGTRVTTTFDRADGILRIEGTDNADTIRIVQNPDHTISVDGVTITDFNGATVTEVSSISEGLVLRIAAQARGGDDKVAFDDSQAVASPIIPVEFIGGAGNDRLVGGRGDDRQEGQDGIDNLWGGGGNDRLYGDADQDFVFGEAGKDKLYGLDGNDYMEGGADNDTLDGGLGNDALHGGVGNDFLDGQDGDDIAFGDVGLDAINGEGGNDYLDGGDDTDFIYAGAGQDTVYGQGGDDDLHGGDDRDFVYGGVGGDWIFGEGGDDEIDGQEDSDQVYGGTGWDTLYGSLGHDSLYGGDGNDWIDGWDDNDEIHGDGGNDTLHGGTGDDWIDGWTENDEIRGWEGADTLHGGLGNDWIDGWEGNDEIRGWEGADTLHGGLGNDWIDGWEGDDEVRGWEGADTLHGGTGNDWIDGWTEDDEIHGWEGNDTLHGGTGDDWIDGWTENDEIRGWEGADTLFGGSNDDVLYGGEGLDRLDGGEGNDGLFGGVGWVEELTGGGGSDRFLRSDEDRAMDRTPDVDALIRFVGDGAGVWTNGEIEVLDKGLHWLHQTRGNAGLINWNGDDEQTIERVLSLGTNVMMDNDSEGRIRVANWAFNAPIPADVSIVHEIGHNWDDESPIWDEWQGMSGWDHLGWFEGVDDGQWKSLDGDWAYNASAAFARVETVNPDGSVTFDSYGRTSPKEDWCTFWEAAYIDQTYPLSAGLRLNYNFATWAPFQAKLQRVERFIQFGS